MPFKVTFVFWRHESRGEKRTCTKSFLCASLNLNAPFPSSLPLYSFPPISGILLPLRTLSYPRKTPSSTKTYSVLLGHRLRNLFVTIPQSRKRDGSSLPRHVRNVFTYGYVCSCRLLNDPYGFEHNQWKSEGTPLNVVDLDRSKLYHRNIVGQIIKKRVQ